MNLLLLSFLLIFSIQILFFIFAASLKTDKVTDFAYGTSFIINALFILLITGNISWEKILLLIMISFWGFRLVGYLFIRILKIKKDKRFDGIREDFWRFASFWFLQAVSIWIISLPITLLMKAESTKAFALTTGLGTFIWIIGFVLEATSDQQKFAFLNKSENQGKFIDTGLWAYSRHPNYFGEILCWVGIFIYVASLLEGGIILLLASPLFITILLLFVSGIPPSEKVMDEKFGKNSAYLEYKKKTPILIPDFFTKKISATMVLSGVSINAWSPTSEGLLQISAITLSTLLITFIIIVLKSNKVLTKQKDQLEKQYKEIKEQYETLVRIKEDVRAGKKFEMAVKSTSDQIIITDPEGIILYANPAIEEISGYDPIKVLGKKAGSKDLWGGQMEKGFYKNFWKTIKEEKKPFKGTFENKKKDGSPYFAQTTVSPVLDDTGEVSFFVGIERDITKEKEIEKMKDDFVSLVSHQMRTPLSAIKWYLESLIDESAGCLNKEQKDCAIDMYDSNQRMIDLVNALLNVSRVESGRIVVNPEPTDLKKLLEEVIKEARARVSGKEFNIDLDIVENLPLIMLDAQLIRNVYLNILTNSLKYSPEKRDIKISLYKKAETLISKFEDNGYGIPKEDQEKLFNKFFRGSNAVKAEPSGTGLGLYLAKAIVESSGGKIRFESELDKGTTFWIELPFVVAENKKIDTV